MRLLPACLSFASALSALTVTLWSPPAEAFERQWHVGASFGYALVSTDTALHGYGGGLHLAYGLSDAFNAVIEADLTTHPNDPSSPLLLNASGGATYVLDVLQWVPYAGVMVGGYDLVGDASCGATNQGCHNPLFGVSIPFGLDYLVTRDVAVGFAGRYHLMPIDGTVNYLTLFGRVEYIWGF